jgi:hypothetical protein
LLSYEFFIIRLFSIVTLPLPSLFGSAVMITLYYGALMIFAYHYHAHGARSS